MIEPNLVGRRLLPFLPTFLSKVVVIAAVVAGISSTAAHAQCLVRAQAGAAFQELTSGVASANDSTTYGSSATSASYGKLFANSSVSLSDTQSDGGSNPIPIARFEDTLTVAIPSQPGLFSGTMTIAFYVVGEPTIELSAGGAGSVHNMNTSYNMIGSRSGGGLYSVNGGRLQGTGSVPEMSTVGTVPAPGRVEVDFPVVFGSPFTLAFDLITVTGGNQVLLTGQNGFVIGTTTMSFFWDGIESIRDGSDNELLSQAVITSCSGTNWLESQAPPPVPVGPFVWGCTALGALILVRGLVRPHFDAA